MRFLTLQVVADFEKTLQALRNPRMRRAMLDSAYAGFVRQGSIGDAKAITAFGLLLKKYGYQHHAIKMTLAKMPDVTGMKVEAIATFHGGFADGHQTLSIGERLVNSGPGWSVTEPICAIVVPQDDKYTLGYVLTGMPPKAVPVELFFQGT